MRGKLFGIAVLLLVLMSRVSIAQTPTGGPSPAPTPPPHFYRSGELMANTNTTNNQQRASVADNPDGGFLIAWNGDAAQTGFFDIQAQLFDRHGVKVGPEFQVDQAPAGRVEFTPDVAAGGNGNYIVVWADFNQTVTDSEIQMRRFDAAGAPLGAAVQVNTHTTGMQRLPQVAAAPSGKFVVVWESAGQDGDGLGVFGQQFNAAGAPVGGEFAVNTYTTGDQDRAVLDMNDNRFTVAFEDGQGGISARDFGAFLGPGAQYPVLTNAQGPGIGILDGTSNTMFAGERLGDIWASRHYPGGSSEFVVGPSSTYLYFQPHVSRNEAGTDVNICWGAQTPAPVQYTTFCREFAWNGTRLFDEGQKWQGWTTALLPYIEQDSAFYGQRVAVGQRSSGSNDEVFYRYSHHPAAVNFEFGDGSVRFIKQNTDYSSSAVIFNALGTSDSFESTLADGSLRPASFNTVVINDGTADYGSVPPGGTADCSDTADCFNIRVPGPRPSLHWDEAVTETLNTGVSKTWLLHVAESFADVPDTNLFIEFIENLLHNGITAGGACGGYCPTDGVKRQQMAVFLLKSRFGQNFVPPPATGTVFTDVPLSNPFASWIETLFLLGVTGGCSGGPPPAPIQFCPDATVNRQQMAVFLLKAFEGSSYVPPAATGIFQDLPPGNPFAAWAEELYDRGVTGGCVPPPLQYCPTNPTIRQQMAAFLVKPFGLQLYGP